MSLLDLSGLSAIIASTSWCAVGSSRAAGAARRASRAPHRAQQQRRDNPCHRHQASQSDRRSQRPRSLSGCRSPPNRAFKASPRLIARAKDMHYYTPDGRAVLDGTAGLWCTNAGHNREPIVAAIQRAGGRARLSRRPSSSRHPQGVRAREPRRRARARRSRPRVLLQFGLGGGRHRAQDRARLPPRARRGRAHAPDRARARLSRRRLRRHLGRRHRQQPQVLRHAAGRRRSPAAHLQPRAPGLHQGRAGMGRASRRRARAHRRAARRLDHRRRDRRADGRLDRRAAARPRAICSGCARSATSTASC